MLTEQLFLRQQSNQATTNSLARSWELVKASPLPLGLVIKDTLFYASLPACLVFIVIYAFNFVIVLHLAVALVGGAVTFLLVAIYRYEGMSQLIFSGSVERGHVDWHSQMEQQKSQVKMLVVTPELAAKKRIPTYGQVLDISDQHLVEIARRVLDGAAFNQKLINSIHTSIDYNQLYVKMLEFDVQDAEGNLYRKPLLAMKGKSANAGFEVTDYGRKIFQALVDGSAGTSPTE